MRRRLTDVHLVLLSIVPISVSVVSVVVAKTWFSLLGVALGAGFIGFIVFVSWRHKPVDDNHHE